MHVALRGDIRKRGPEAPPLRIECNVALYDMGSGRQLADSIAHPDNPRTTRVMVNCPWMHHFGRPLVTSRVISGHSAMNPVTRYYLTGRQRTCAIQLVTKRLHRAILLSSTFNRAVVTTTSIIGLMVTTNTFMIFLDEWTRLARHDHAGHRGTRLTFHRSAAR